MARRLVPIAAALLVLLALPASGGGGTSGRKSAIDARLHRVQAKIAWADRRRRELAAQIAGVNSRIQSLSREVGDVSARLVTIERDLALHQEKLDKLNELFKVETERYFSFRHQYDITVERLDGRLVDIYENGEPTDLDVLLSAKSFSDLISQAEYLERSATRTSASPERWARPRSRRAPSASARRSFAQPSRRRPTRSTCAASRCALPRETLLAEQHGLAAARQNKHESLVAVTESKREYVHEAAGLAQASAQLASTAEPARASYHPGPAVRRRLHLAGERPGDEPVRHALGTYARRHRHRRAGGRRSTRLPPGRSSTPAG